MDHESPTSTADSIPEELDQENNDNYRCQVESLVTLLPEVVPGDSPLEKLTYFIKNSKSSVGEESGLSRSVAKEDVKQLQDVQSKLEEENKALRDKNGRLEAQYRQLKDQLQGRSAKFKQESELIKTEKKELEAQVNKLEMELKKRQVENQKLRTERDKNLKEVNSLKKDREGKQGIVIKLEGRIKVLEGQLAKAKDDLQVASKPSSELPCERSSEVHTQRKSIGDMETKVKLLEDQLISTKESVTNEKQIKEKFEAERTRLYAEKTELESKQATLERRLKEKDGALKQLQTRSDALDAELKAKRQKLKELSTADGSKLRSRVAGLQLLVDKYEREAKDSKQHAELKEKSHHTSLKKRDAQISSLSAELVTVREELSGVLARNELLSNELAKEKEAVEKLSLDKKESQSQMEEKLTRSNTEVVQLTAEVCRMKDQVRISEERAQEEKAESRILSQKIKDLEQACGVLQIEKEESQSQMEEKLTVANTEVVQLTAEVCRMKDLLRTNEERAQEEKAESKILSQKIKDLEQACGVLQIEKEELSGHIEEMVQKVSLAQASKEKMTVDLKEKTQQCRRAESQLAKKLLDLSATEEKLRTTKLILSVEQKKVDGLHADLITLKERREANLVERFQLEENQEMIKQLKMRVENLQELLHQEQLERVKLQEHEKDLKQQITLLSQEKSELLSTIAQKDIRLQRLEIKVKTLKEKTATLKEQVRHCQEESKGLEERASLSEQHAKAFQEMLLLREEEMEADLKKATLQKRRSHEKLNLSREKHTRKRLSLESDNASLRESLHQLQLKLQQEDQWKTSVEGTCKVLQRDKNHLNAKIAAMEVELRDVKWSLLEKESRIDHLEKENQLLEERSRLLLNIPKMGVEQQLMSSSLDSGMSSLLFKEMMLK